MSRKPSSARAVLRFASLSSVFVPILAVMLLAFGALLNDASAQDDFLDPEDAFRFSAAMSGPSTLDLHYEIAPEYYMYRERFELNAPEGVVAGAAYPPGLVKYDPTFEKDMEVYYGEVTVRVQLAQGSPEAGEGADAGAGQGAAGALTFGITSQGCADAGLCYPPETRELQLARNADGSWSVSGAGVAKSVPQPLTVVLGGDGKPLNGQASAADRRAANASTGAAADQADLNPFYFGDTGLADWLQGGSWEIGRAACRGRV